MYTVAFCGIYIYIYLFPLSLDAIIVNIIILDNYLCSSSSPSALWRPLNIEPPSVVLFYSLLASLTLPSPAAFSGKELGLELEQGLQGRCYFSSTSTPGQLER